MSRINDSYKACSDSQQHRIRATAPGNRLEYFRLFGSIFEQVCYLQMA